MVAKTKSAAQWMHFAPSNLFTAEIAPRAQALLSFGIEHPTVPMTPGRKSMKKDKFAQNVAMELNNRALSGS